MSSKQNLNAFFDKNKKKKAPAKPATQDNVTNAASIQEPDAAVVQEPKPIKESKKQKLDYESSEEEKADLVIDQNIAVLNKAEVDAQKRKKLQE